MMFRPLLARIDISALQHNLQQVRRFAPNQKILAVIKANAYGHGTLAAAQAWPDADGFGMLSLEEAIMLRQAGIRQPIVLLEGVFAPEALPLCAEHGITVVIHQAQQIEWLGRAWLPRKIDVWVKMNSGMNRLGLPAGEFQEAVEKLAKLPAINHLTLMSHFATADEVDGVAMQLADFMVATAGMPYPRSLANSAAIVGHPDTHAEWGRPGIMLYGASPVSGRPPKHWDLRPVMTLESRIIAEQRLAPGDAIGYGATFHADYPMRIGVVACGYADGYPRHAPTGTPVGVGGHRTRLLGRVSMDMITVDLTGLPDCGIGSTVELWGKQIGVDEVAAAAGTLGYELLSGMTARVPYSYL